MDQNERYYQKVVGSVGVSLLFFLLFFYVSQLGLVFFSMFLPMNTVAGELVYETLYAVCYLSSFMVPVAIMRKLIKQRGYAFQPMYTTFRFPKISFLAIPLGIALLHSASYINTAIVDLFQFESVTNQVIVNTGSLEPYQIVLQFILIALVPGFCEEFLFRGAILTNCLPFGRANAILISSLLFSLMHQNPSQFLYTFVAGLALGVLYERSGSIWPGVLLHTLNNFVSVIRETLEMNLDNVVDFAMIMTVFEMIIVFLGIGAAIFFAVRYFSQKKDFRSGVFEKSFTASDAYATVALSAKQLKTLFWTPSMITFVVICLSDAVLMLGMAVLYGIFF